MTRQLLAIPTQPRAPRAARIVAVVAFAIAALLPTQSEAQYFGRNKPQYQHFDFRVLNSQHFGLHFYPPMQDRAQDAARMLERWYTRESSLMNHEFSRRDVILYADAPDFQQTNVIEGELTEGTGGVTESLHSRIVLPLTGVAADDEHVLGHELVHVFQYDIAQSDTNGNGLNSMDRLPLWVVEGMAEYLSVGPDDPHTAMWMRDAVLQNDIPSIAKLGKDPRYFPYRYGQALWAYIGGRWGDRDVPVLFKTALSTGWDRAVARVLGLSVDSLSDQWHAELRRAYEPLMSGRTAPDKVGTPVVVDHDRGAMNVSPALSPDGRYVAFFSERDLFSVDLFLADAATGKIVKQLASPTRSGQHFDALSFIASAGAWSPDSRRFAAVAYAQGDNELEIIDVASRDVVQRIHVQGVSAISGPAWSPDGRSIALSGSSGGTSDIYVVDVKDQSVRQLTHDAYSDLQPTWSPDGKTIAFASDRGSGTDLDRLAFAPMRIALVPATGGAAEPLLLLPEGKQINPQFSPDGASLYFVSDADGFSDIYRASLATHDVSRITRVATGISGVTYLSPAISIAAQTGRLMFSVFERGGMNIYALDSAMAGTPAPASGREAGMLPPFDRKDPVVPTYLADEDRGLVQVADLTIEPYRSHLRLDYIGQPTLSVSTSSFGTAVGGSVSLEFGETLGNRIVGVGVGGQGRLSDFGGQLMYLDRGHRVNWMTQVSRNPYVTGYITEDTTHVSTSGGPVPAALLQEVLIHTYFNELGGALQYPFSTTQRVEFSLTGTRVSYGTQVRRVTIVGNSVVDDRTSDTASSPSVSFVQTSAALVGDNSYAGYTSPILGTRYRLEAGPTLGGLQFVTLLADGRRYFWHRPLTLAFRAMHFGRYGSGAEDARISPVFVGDAGLVRGYTAESFNGDECSSDGTGICPEFDRLVGSRFAVANAELRIQLMGPAALALIPSGFLPLELSPFLDAGMAWTREQSPSLRFDRGTTDRVPVVSTGLSLRTNLFGYVVAEAFYAIPFQRPGRDHVWGLQFAPGW